MCTTRKTLRAKDEDLRIRDYVKDDNSSSVVEPRCVPRRSQVRILPVVQSPVREGKAKMEFHDEILALRVEVAELRRLVADLHARLIPQPARKKQRKQQYVDEYDAAKVAACIAKIEAKSK